MLSAANRRYLDFISSMDDPTIPTKRLQKVTKPAKVNGRSYKGFNFFDDADLLIFESILRGEHTISGMRNKDLRRHLHDMSPGQVSRHLKRLRTHGLIIPKYLPGFLPSLAESLATDAQEWMAQGLIPLQRWIHPYGRIVS